MICGLIWRNIFQLLRTNFQSEFNVEAVYTVGLFGQLGKFVQYETNDLCFCQPGFYVQLYLQF